MGYVPVHNPFYHSIQAKSDNILFTLLWLPFLMETISSDKSPHLNLQRKLKLARRNQRSRFRNHVQIHKRYSCPMGRYPIETACQ